MKIGTKSLRLALAVLAAGGLTACEDDTTTEPVVLNAPTGVEAVEVDAGIEVSWSAVSGAESYTVERDIIGDDGDFTAIAEGVTETTYLDEDVTRGTTYQYRVIAVDGTEESAASDPADVTLGEKKAELSGTITGVRELSADTLYILKGTVTVDSAAELHIPAGTVVQADVNTQPTALIVRQGGKIFADGTADAPIVFTSSAPEGQRKRGDWGGIVLNGYSHCNFPQGECVGEGSSGPYGGDNPQDSSGRMTYVRIEYAGYEVSFGNELNALTLNGVGSGTELHHIQAHYGLDDGIEFFGGTVDLKYAIVTGASDDSFDYSTGWQGRGQFWIVQQDPGDADNGFEVDNNESDYNLTPRTNPVIYNITLVGKGPEGGTAGESTRGLKLRRGTAGKIYNAIVMGFGDSGLDIDNTETYDQCAAGELVVANSVFYENAAYLDGDDDDETACTGLSAWAGLQETDPMLADPYNREAPDFRPQDGSPALSGAATPPSDGFFDAVDYIGAVAPTGTPWYEGWITLDQS